MTKEFLHYGQIQQRYGRGGGIHMLTPLTDLVGDGKKELKWTEYPSEGL